ncbi:MAG TPA: hypothetical protein VJ723_15095 [Candidatus Angelobacter sp.]|nr:hypothetical protein [Candidatus Angelobacter sp.]
MISRTVALLLGLAGFVSCVIAQQASQKTALTQNSHEVTITITEPAIYKLEDLLKKADTVALVKVVSGDTEAYDSAIYKAVVVKSFKGAADGEIIYFGPFIGERLGWEYVVFLQSVAKPIAPKATANAGYGTVHYGAIFDQGYGSMETSYQCVFDGNDTAQQCDYGVRVCTDYIKLPKSTAVFPSATEDTPFGCRWVRKRVFIPLLKAVASPGTSK